MRENWGVFKKGDGTYHVIFIPFREDTDGTLMSRWPTRPEAKRCCDDANDMHEKALLAEAGQLDLFEEG